MKIYYPLINYVNIMLLKNNVNDINKVNMSARSP